MRHMAWILMAVMLLAFHKKGLAADPVPTKPTSSTQSASDGRLAELNKNVGALDVSVWIFINGKGDEEELHLLGPDHPGGYKEPFFARLSKDQMNKLLNHLALEGFLADAMDSRMTDRPPPAPPVPPYLKLSVGDFYQYSPMGPETVKRLEGIKAVLSDKAARKMEGLLAKVREKTGFRFRSSASSTPVR